MPTYEVVVQGKKYEVDAPDENTAWQWANYTNNHPVDLPTTPKFTSLTPLEKTPTPAFDPDAYLASTAESGKSQKDKATDGVFSTGLVLILTIGAVLLIKDHFRNKSKESPHELGVWLASFGACGGFALGLLGLLNGKVDLIFHPSAWADWMLGNLLGSTLLLGVACYISGQGYRRLRLTNSNDNNIRASSSANEAQPSEAHWAQALAEFDGPARRDVLWAKCFAEAGGVEAVAKAAYLNERAKQILAESSNR